MNKTFTVTVGLPAYNEEKNIQNVLGDIISQKQLGWKLAEIIVYSDASNDKTISQVKKFRYKTLKTIDGKIRRGKAYGLSQIFKLSKGDAVIFFDSDTRLVGKNVITDLVKSLKEDKVMLVGGNSLPFKPRTFFERSVYSTFLVFEEARKKINNGHNIFGCTGQIIGVKKKFAKEIKFPRVINEDDFLYFSCLKKGYVFRHVKTATVLYKLPQNLGDYLRQVFRSNPEAVAYNVDKYFGKLVEKEYKRGKLFYAKSVAKAFIGNPLGVAYIGLINIICKPLFPIFSKKYKLEWYTAQSTK